MRLWVRKPFVCKQGWSLCPTRVFKILCQKSVFSFKLSLCFFCFFFSPQRHTSIVYDIGQVGTGSCQTDKIACLEKNKVKKKRWTCPGTGFCYCNNRVPEFICCSGGSWCICIFAGDIEVFQKAVRLILNCYPTRILWIASPTATGSGWDYFPASLPQAYLTGTLCNSP